MALLKEVEAALSEGGLDGLRAWAQANTSRIDGEFLLLIARGGGRSMTDLGFSLARTLAIEKGDPKTLADILYYGGVFYSQTSKNREAAESLDSANRLYVQLGDLSGQADVCQTFGELYFYLGEYPKALEMAEKARLLYEKASNPKGQGRSCLGIGQIYSRTGDLGRALALYERARTIYEESKSTLGRANVGFLLGELYAHLGDLDKALKLEEEALSLYEILDEPLGQGNAAEMMGNIHFLAGNYDKALSLGEKALSFYEAAQDIVGQANIFQLQGDIHSLRKDEALALERYAKARSLYEKAQDTVGQGNIRRKEGNSHSRTREDAKALSEYDEAISLYRKAGAFNEMAIALFKKGSVFARKGPKDQALRLYEEALRDLEMMRARTAVLGLKKLYTEKVYTGYEEASRFMLGNGYPERAFGVVESMKARSFLDMLAESLVSLDEGLDPALRERRDALTAKLSASAKAISRTRDPDKLRAFEREQAEGQAEFEALLTEIRLKNSAYAAVFYPQPVGLETLQKKILRPHEVLVEYHFAEERAYAFVVTPSSFGAVELPGEGKNIRDAVGQYLDRIIGAPGADIEDAQGRLTAGAAAYDLLIRPIAASLPENATLIIVPDDVLARLPFECLIVSVEESTGKPVYLLERHPIKYIQSASVLAFLRTQSPRTGIGEAFVGFGDPVYDYENFNKGAPEYGMPGYESPPDAAGDAVAELNRNRYAGEGGSLKRLRGSGQEVAEIAELFKARGLPEGKIQPRLRRDATEEVAKSPAMADYGYIHFSCHGVLGGGFQSLVLSQIPDSKEDGYLTLGEVVNLKFNARLVVLSACETGKGKEERGEGVTGLTRAVMKAGAPAAAVSLWSVSDAATRELMVRFYRDMINEGLEKDEALRRAKLERLRDDRWVRISDSVSIPAGHPLFWAAFVLYGE